MQLIKVDNLVIGGGISGCTFADFSKDDYLIVEKDEKLGGLCKTVYKNNFVWDYSGHFIHVRTNTVRDYLSSISNKYDLIKINKNTKIYYQNRYVDFPFQSNIHQLKLKEFLKASYSLLTSGNNRRKRDSFKKMIYGRFGDYISDSFLLPYNEKLYSCDLDVLSVSAMGRFFPENGIFSYVYKKIFKRNTSYNEFFLHPREGVNYYIDKIESRLDEKKIKRSTQIKAIDINSKKATLSDNSIIKYTKLISTIPLTKLYELCGVNYDRNIYTYSKVLVFNFGFAELCEVDMHWVYYPGKEFVFYRVGFWSNIYGEDRLSLYVEVSFDCNDNEIDIEGIREIVLKDLKNAGVVKNKDPIDEHHILIDPAYIHIRDDVISDVEDKINWLSDYDIYPIGRYGMWKYCSIEDNILDAISLAERI